MSNARSAILAADLEGVFIPEVWIAVAEATGIEKLQLTTRDISDYDELMQMRLGILREHDLTITDIQRVIDTMDPLPGAAEFVAWVRERMQLIILTDSYYQFIAPFMAKLGHPTAFAHRLEIAPSGHITGYKLRTEDGKRQAVRSFGKMGFRTIAIGDSYNDTKMLLAADDASLYKPPANVIEEFPQLAVSTDYAQLKSYIEAFLNGQ